MSWSNTLWSPNSPHDFCQGYLPPCWGNIFRITLLLLFLRVFYRGLPCPPFLDQVTLFGYKKGYHSRDQISCLPNFDRSTIPVKFFIRILKMVVFHTFEVSRHVNALSAHNQVKCKLCATEFNNNNVQVIKCHMESVHGHQFGDSVATQPKKPKSGFQIKISREQWRVKKRPLG